jgi:cytochrome P450
MGCKPPAWRDLRKVPSKALRSRAVDAVEISAACHVGDTQFRVDGQFGKSAADANESSGLAGSLGP